MVPEIFRESEAYYVLGVERGVSDRPDARASIEVKVGRKGLRVHAQRQYVLPPAQTGASAGRAGVGGPGVGPGSPQPVAAECGPAARAGRHGLRQSRQRQAHRPCQRRYGSVRPQRRHRGAAGHRRHGDGSDRPVGRRRRDRRRRSPALVSGLVLPSKGMSPSHEINVQSHVELAPGDYGLRVAVSDPATGKVASVFSDVTVPKFDSAPLSLSGVTVDIASISLHRAGDDDETSVSAG